MALPAAAPLTAADFTKPEVRLYGPVDYAMYGRFREQLERAGDSKRVIVELSTLGGDPEVARMMGEDIRFQSAMSPQQRLVFLGKAAIYSAGTTFHELLRARKPLPDAARASWCTNA